MTDWVVLTAELVKSLLTIEEVVLFTSRVKNTITSLIYKQEALDYRIGVELIPLCIVSPSHSRVPLPVIVCSSLIDPLVAWHGLNG